jgi:hypothetical protein
VTDGDGPAEYPTAEATDQPTVHPINPTNGVMKVTDERMTVGGVMMDDGRSRDEHGWWMLASDRGSRARWVMDDGRCRMVMDQPNNQPQKQPTNQSFIQQTPQTGDQRSRMTDDLQVKK